MEMIERRISDRSILRLIGKWIHVGVIDDGRLLRSETGIGQGQVISPFLANVYLHQVLDRWFEDEVKPRLKGKAFVVRYVDDAVICFQNYEDAQRVLEVLAKRFSKYGLSLHPQKARLVEFGRAALTSAEKRGTQPANGEGEDDEETPEAQPQGHSAVVPPPSSRSGQRTTSHPQREAAGPLPILRPCIELPEPLAVLRRGSRYLAEVAQPQNAGHHPALGKISATAATPSARVAAHCPFLG